VACSDFRIINLAPFNFKRIMVCITVLKRRVVAFSGVQSHAARSYQYYSAQFVGFSDGQSSTS
jgi:hypothetical protein